MKKTFLILLSIFSAPYCSLAQDSISTLQSLRNDYVFELNKEIELLNWQTQRVYVLFEELVNYKEIPREDQLIAKGGYINIERAQSPRPDEQKLEEALHSLPQLKSPHKNFFTTTEQLKNQAELIRIFYTGGKFKNNPEKGTQLINNYQKLLRKVYLLRDEILGGVPIEKINNSDQDNPWIRTGKATLPIITHSELALQSFYDFKSEALLDTTALHQLRNQLAIFWQAKEDNLNGLLRLFPNRRNNPDNTYKWIQVKTKRVLFNYKNQAYFDPWTNHGFNDIIEEYNGLVDMALEKNFNAKTHPRYFEGKRDSLRPVFLPYYLNGVSLLPIWNQSSSPEARTDSTPSLEGFKINNLVFVLDVSGSMAQDEKIATVKNKMMELVEVMRTEDEITIVTYAGKARKVLRPTSAKKHRRIKKKLYKLKAGGFTNLNEGMKLAYSLAESNFENEGNNRIILITDGAVRANRNLQEMIAQYADQNIHLSLLTFENEKDNSLVQLSEHSSAFLSKINKENIFSVLLNEAKRGGLQ